MENTKEEVLVQRKGFNLERIKDNLKRNKVMYYFLMILSILMMIDFILINKFVTTILYM